MRPLSKPLAIDLYAGLGGWAEGFLAEGYDVIGFDIERHRYPARDMSQGVGRKVVTDGVDFQKRNGTSRERSFNYANQCALREAPLTGEWCEYPGQLVLQDVLTLHGSQFRNAAVIVASPPCQAYSYRAMPWKRAKALPPPSNELFDACFRIQREASEAAERYIPLVVENVKGAQKWVGRAQWHFGSFYLWGDVPALMPTTRQLKQAGRNFHFPEKYCIPSPSFHGANHEPSVKRAEAIKNNGGSWFAIGSPGQTELKRNPVHEGTKVIAKEFAGYGGDFGWDQSRMRQGNSHSAAKQASAEIAKIPWDLANWIARVYKP